MAAVSSTTTTLQAGVEANQQVEPAVLNLIADYNIHHFESDRHDEKVAQDRVEIVSGVWREPQPTAFDPSLVSHPLVPYPVSNPSWWIREYRSVPDYRPINKELDLSQRRQNLVFTIVGGIMIGGCIMTTIWSQLWRGTAGRFTDYGLTRIGGEW